MSWKKVGEFLTNNAAKGVGLVGSLLTGNIPGAISAGAALVSSATGTASPDDALDVLQKDPQSMLKLKELQIQNEASIRQHIENMTRMKLEDEQASHKETQTTIRNGDNSEYWFIRFTRPGQSWASLIAAFIYVAAKDNIDIYVLGALLTLPWAYAGLRQVGKGLTAFNERKAIEAINK